MGKKPLTIASVLVTGSWSAEILELYHRGFLHTYSPPPSLPPTTDSVLLGDSRHWAFLTFSSFDNVPVMSNPLPAVAWAGKHTPFLLSRSAPRGGQLGLPVYLLARGWKSAGPKARHRFLLYLGQVRVDTAGCGLAVSLLGGLPRWPARIETGDAAVPRQDRAMDAIGLGTANIRRTSVLRGA